VRTLFAIWDELTPTQISLRTMGDVSSPHGPDANALAEPPGAGRHKALETSVAAVAHCGAMRSKLFSNALEVVTLSLNLGHSALTRRTIAVSWRHMSRRPIDPRSPRTEPHRWGRGVRRWLLKIRSLMADTMPSKGLRSSLMRHYYKSSLFLALLLRLKALRTLPCEPFTFR
jgi:hypothetical protein